MVLSTEEDCRKFLATENIAAIAQQIRQDEAACRQLRLPSLLALYLPPISSRLGNAIALELFPEMSLLPKSIRSAQYSGTRTILRSAIQQMAAEPKHDLVPSTSFDTSSLWPSNEDLETALDVLHCVLESSSSGISLRTPLQDVVQYLKLRRHESQSDEAAETQNLLPPSIAKSIRNIDRKKCYMCHHVLFTPHAHYSSLCKACGEYNLASSALSAPTRLNLQGKIALVTGGRINLGFHTALRLLRCGARVIVSSRYPRDAETRFLAERDSSEWSSELRIIGADFRSASDVFHLLQCVKHCLREWTGCDTVVLDILINNAAQTLTDPLEKEEAAINRERNLLIDSHRSSLISGEYMPRVRGGVSVSKILTARDDLAVDSGGRTYAHQHLQTPVLSNHAQGAITSHTSPKTSSWLQSIHEIPYQDVISAHSVNTFVPLILIRELLPIMRSDTGNIEHDQGPIKASSYIINVSSREGIFESMPKSGMKNGKHVHTNLTKAALNMLTETEAAPAWKNGKVAINSVDPGFMSAAPEIERRWQEKTGEPWTSPIGWEDGAARVLWPIAVSESGKGAVWGKFLKHFGAVEVEVNAGT